MPGQREYDLALEALRPGRQARFFKEVEDECVLQRNDV